MTGAKKLGISTEFLAPAAFRAVVRRAPPNSQTWPEAGGCGKDAWTPVLAVVLRQREDDVTCLVSPPRSPPPHFLLACASTAANATTIASLVSAGCQVHLSPDGSLRRAGKIKRSTLASVQSESLVSPAGRATAERLAEDCEHLAAQDASYAAVAQCWRGLYESVSVQEHRCPLVNVSRLKPGWLLRDIARAHTPVRLSNTGVSSWPALSKWSLHHLERIAGDAPLHVKEAPGGEFEGSEPAEWWACPAAGAASSTEGMWRTDETVEVDACRAAARASIPQVIQQQLQSPDRVVARPAGRDMPARALVQELRHQSRRRRLKGRDHARDTSLYVEYLSLSSYLHQLWSDVPLHGPLAPQGNDSDRSRKPTSLEREVEHLRLAHKNIWIGDGHTLGKAHTDAFENLLIPVRGRKRVFLFPPYNTSWLYPGHMREAQFQRSPSGTLHRDPAGLQTSTSIVNTPVDILNPNFGLFPAFRGALPLATVCDVQPGEVLYLPSHWWHEVESAPDEELIAVGEADQNIAVNFWYEPLFTRAVPCQGCALDMDWAYTETLGADSL